MLSYPAPHPWTVKGYRTVTLQPTKGREANLRAACTLWEPHQAFIGVFLLQAGLAVRGVSKSAFPEGCLLPGNDLSMLGAPQELLLYKGVVQKGFLLKPGLLAALGIHQSTRLLHSDLFVVLLNITL